MVALRNVFILKFKLWGASQEILLTSIFTHFFCALFLFPYIIIIVYGS